MHTMPVTGRGSAIYRIALEALTNVIHHARAQNCQIKLSVLADPYPEIQSEIVDDGVGLPANLESGVGLTSMRERAQAIVLAKDAGMGKA